MYAITGATGKVGGELARTLLAAGLPVRVVVRDAATGPDWAARGAQVALADIADDVALARAFAGATAAFILLPPQFDPSPGYPEARARPSRLWRPPSPPRGRGGWSASPPSAPMPRRTTCSPNSP